MTITALKSCTPFWSAASNSPLCASARAACSAPVSESSHTIPRITAQRTSSSVTNAQRDHQLWSQHTASTAPTAKQTRALEALEGIRTYDPSDVLNRFIALLDTLISETDATTALSTASLMATRMWMLSADEMLILMQRFIVGSKATGGKPGVIKSSHIANIVVRKYRGNAVELIDQAVASFGRPQKAVRTRAMEIVASLLRHDIGDEEDRLYLAEKLILQSQNAYLDDKDLRRMGTMTERLLTSLCTGPIAHQTLQTLDNLSYHQSPLIRTFVLALLNEIAPLLRHQARLFGFFTAVDRFGDADVRISILGRDVARSIHSSLTVYHKLALIFMDTHPDAFEA